MVNIPQKLPLIACVCSTVALALCVTALNSRFWSYRSTIGSRSPFWDPRTDELSAPFLIFKVPGIIAAVGCIALLACCAGTWVYLMTWRSEAIAGPMPAAKALKNKVQKVVMGLAVAAAALNGLAAVWWAAALGVGLGWGFTDLAWSWWLLLLSAVASAGCAAAWQEHHKAPYVPPPVIVLEAEDGRPISAGFDRRGRPRMSQDYDHLGLPVTPYRTGQQAAQAPGVNDGTTPVQGSVSPDPSAPVAYTGHTALSPPFKVAESPQPGASPPGHSSQDSATRVDVTAGARRGATDNTPSPQ